MNGIDVSVCLCTRNNVDSLRRRLPALVNAVETASMTTELVIVDNGSVDATAEFLAREVPSHPHVRVFHEREQGLAVARNRAAHEALGDVLLMTDDDVEVPPGWVDSLAGPCLRAGADAVAGEVRLAPHLVRSWMTAYHRIRLAESLNLGLEPPMLVGASMAVRRDLAVEYGWDTELGAGRLGFGEDILFWLRLRADGKKIMRATEAPVRHFFDERRLQRNRWLEASRREGRSDAYIQHHWAGSDLRFLQLRALKHDAIRLIRTAARMSPRGRRTPADPKELACVRQAALLRALARERQRTPRYRSAHGGLDFA